MFRSLSLVAITLLAALSLAARPATNDELHLLTEALTKVGQGMDRWAYTETVLVKDDKGKVKEDRIVRRDPSQPYAEQEVPLRIRGKPPTEKKLKEFRQRCEKRGKRIESNERLGKANGPKQTIGDTKQTVGDIVNLPGAFIAEEDGDRLTYELPLRKLGNTRFPPEKFQVLVRVAKESRMLIDAGVKLREPLRAKVVVKINSGGAHVDFTVVDPKYPPVMTAVRGDASATIMFVQVGGTVDVKRTDYRRVKPYNEKFDVQIGPLRTLDF